MKKILVLMLLTVFCSAAELDLLEDHKKVNLYKKDFKYPYFNVSEEDRNTYKKINSIILSGDYERAKKIATRFYNNKHSYDNKNKIAEQLSNIALGNVYEANGDIYKWKYMHLESLKFFLSKEKNNLAFSDYMFGILELQDILIFTEKKERVQNILNILKGEIMEDKSVFTKESMNLALMNIELVNAKMAYKLHFKDAALMHLAKSENKLKKIYTYYSLNEAHLLLLKANIIYDLSGDNSKTLQVLKEAYIVSKKLIKKEGLLDKSAFLADIYYFIGNILSSGTKQKESVDYLIKARDIYKKTKLNNKLLNTEFQLINTYKLLKKLDLASTEIKFSLKLAKNTFGLESIEYADVLIAKADTFNSNGDYTESLNLMKEAKRIYTLKYGKYSKEVKMLNSTLNYINLQLERYL